MQHCHCNKSKGSARLCRSTSLNRSKARTTSGENGLEFFAVGLDDSLRKTRQGPRAREKGKQHGKKGKKGFHEVEGHKNKLETQT